MAGNATARYPQELKDRAVRMVAEIEVRSWNGTVLEWGAVQKVAGL